MYKKEMKVNSAFLSHIVYKNINDIKQILINYGFVFIKWIDNKESDTQVLICEDIRNIFIVFRGTEVTNIADWKTNFNIEFVKHELHGKTHKGFYGDAKCVRDEIKKTIYSKITWKKIVFTGHSQGGSVASESAIISPYFDYIHTIGEPRHFNRVLANYIDSIFKHKIIRSVNNNDIAPRVPFEWMGFKHVGNIDYYTHKGFCITNPTKRKIKITRIAGRIDSIFKCKIDDIKDHNHGLYYNLIKANSTNNSSLILPPTIFI